MKRRIGNDIKIEWAIQRADGTPEDFTNASGIEVSVVSSCFQKKEIQAYEIDGNVVKFQYIASEQQHLGVYGALLTYQKNDASIEGGVATFTVDKVNAFELVEHSQNEDDIDKLILEGSVVFTVSPDSVDDNAPDLLQRYRVAKL